MDSFAKLTLIPVDENLQPQVLAFVREHEVTSVPLLELLLKDFHHVWAFSNENEICGALFCKKHFTLLACLPLAFNTEFCTAAKPLLTALLKEQTPYCITGPTDAVTLLSRCIHLQIAEQRDLMLLAKEYDPSAVPAAAIPCPDDTFLLHCTPLNTDQLFSVQSSYIQEEVLPAFQAYNPESVRYLLEKLLQTQICYALCKDNTVCAKANTNAQGIKWNQLGGIFTAAEFRNKGYASYLVQYLVNLNQSLQKGTVLYVNQNNAAAIRAYQKAGLSYLTDFTMIYYQ